MNTEKEIRKFAGIVFTLFGILFGALIMAFISGNLGPDQAGFTEGTVQYNTTLAIQNNTLEGLESYSGQSDTQFLTVAIAITLLILIFVFGVFWKFFMNVKGSGKNFE